MFTCSPVPDAGLPKAIAGGEDHPRKALLDARKAIDDILKNPIPAAELQACKSLLTNSYTSVLADPQGYVDAILMRYTYGKDVLTNYNARIGSVTAANVQQIYQALSEGIRIEYVVKE